MLKIAVVQVGVCSERVGVFNIMPRIASLIQTCRGSSSLTIISAAEQRVTVNSIEFARELR